MRMSVRRPSPALVISCIALTVALGGTSYATVLNVPRNSVGTPHLKNSAVTSSKVKNRTLLPVDFKTSSLPAGPTGPAGPAGPAGPPGLSGVERVESSTSSTSPQSKQHVMACPAGKRLLGGGARVEPAVAGVALVWSYPDNDNTYRAVAREIVATPANWALTVFAVCANAS